MPWFRSNLRFGSCLAAFALAVQFALSFAHVHLYGIAPASVLAAGWNAQAPADVPKAPAIPSRPDSNGSAGDFCAVCTLIQLTASSLPAAAPALPLPLVSSRVWAGSSVEFKLAALPRLFFQARAPPLA